MQKPIRNLIVCVGTGGVFYHGLTEMSVLLKKMEDCAVILVDDDVVEDKNKMRQWGFDIGQPKVVCAEKVVSLLAPETPVFAVQHKVESEDDLVHIILTAAKDLPKTDKCEMMVENIMIVHAPDNHLCRKVVHSSCPIISRRVKVPVYEITGGNTLADGYAYGCYHEDGQAAKGDFMKRHPDILDSAEAEVARAETPLSCGSLGESGGPEQSVHSNSLTSHCIWKLAEKMLLEDFTGELLWRKEEDGKIHLRELVVTA